MDNAGRERETFFFFGYTVLAVFLGPWDLAIFFLSKQEKNWKHLSEEKKLQNNLERIILGALVESW